MVLLLFKVLNYSAYDSYYFHSKYKISVFSEEKLYYLFGIFYDGYIPTYIFLSFFSYLVWLSLEKRIKNFIINITGSFLSTMGNLWSITQQGLWHTKLT